VCTFEHVMLICFGVGGCCKLLSCLKFARLTKASLDVGLRLVMIFQFLFRENYLCKHRIMVHLIVLKGMYAWDLVYSRMFFGLLSAKIHTHARTHAHRHRLESAHSSSEGD
jgi:hypothetical protein